MSDAPKQRRIERRLYVGNIPFKATQRDVAAYVTEGLPGSAVIEVGIPMNTEKGLNRGYAFVTVALPDGAGPNAWEVLNDGFIGPRQVSVKISKRDEYGG